MLISKAMQYPDIFWCGKKSQYYCCMEVKSQDNSDITIPLTTVKKISSTPESDKDEQNLVLWYPTVVDFM